MSPRRPVLTLDQQASALAARFYSAKRLRVLVHGAPGAGGTRLLQTLCTYVNSVDTTPSFAALYHRSCTQSGIYVPVPAIASAEVIAVDDFEVGYPEYLQEHAGVPQLAELRGRIIAHTGRRDQGAALCAWKRVIGHTPDLIVEIEGRNHLHCTSFSEEGFYAV